MRLKSNRPEHAVLAAAAACLLVCVDGASAQAQGLVQSAFCPTVANSQTGIALQNGTCTNGTTGAFSNAALASQALSDLAQSSTQQTSEVARSSLETRRQTEQERCPDGFERVNGACQRIATAEPPPPPATPSTTPASPAPQRETPRRTRRTETPSPAAPSPRVAVRPRPILKAPPPPVEAPTRYTGWFQAYGDFERRTGTSASSINCCQALAPGGIPIPLTLTGESRATTGGVLAGADMTVRNLTSASDGIILGLMVGYTHSNVRLTTTSTPTPPNPNLFAGSSAMRAQLDGGSVGAYATYFKDQFSADLTFRADLLNLSETFVDTLAFTANAGVNPFVSTFAGAGSTRLNNYTTTGNLNYRIPLSGATWIEPTAGFQYTTSDYEASAAALGLSNGHLLRLQAGARYGVEYFWNDARVTTTVTGLVYDNVDVTGGFIQNVAFGNNALIVNDEGKLRGQGILAFNLEYRNGVSLFAQGDVRGGNDLFGGGGKGGIRWRW
jgi:hypothetical protein